MVWVRFASIAKKLEVMRGKMKLGEKKEYIADNLTKKDRRIK